MGLYFPLAEYWWFYLAFTGFVLLLLVLDLGVFQRDAHAVSMKEATAWSIVWISLALVFNYLFYLYAYDKFQTDPRLLALPGFEPAAAAKQVGLEFLTGYVVEKALAVDNIFIFVMIFSYFRIPAKYQHRVLFFGVLGALVFRALFIAAGSVLMRYQVVIIFFGVFLIFTGIRLMFTDEKEVEPEKNILIRLIRKVLPVTPELHGKKFFIIQNGRRMATPLLVVLAFVEISDILFAVDSVPAIFAVTQEPLIVFTSNIFAILGLRSLYFLLANVVDRFHMLKYGLAAVLIFVGLKMVWLNPLYDGHFPIGISLGVIFSVLVLSVIASLVFPMKASSHDAKSDSKGPEMKDVGPDA